MDTSTLFLTSSMDMPASDHMLAVPHHKMDFSSHSSLDPGFFDNLAVPKIDAATASQFLMMSNVWGSSIHAPIKPPVHEPRVEEWETPTTPANSIFPRTASITPAKATLQDVHQESTPSLPSRSSRKSSNASTAPFPDPTQKPRTKKRKLSGDQLPDHDEEPEQNDEAGTPQPGVTKQKRNRFLERNRVAASKCRQKKKEWIHELEEAKGELEHQNATLYKEYVSLLEEVSHIKNHLMAHANCNDGNIDRWFENEAKRFVQTSMGSKDDRRGSSPSAACQPQTPTRRGSILQQYSPITSPAAALDSPHLKVESGAFELMASDMFNEDMM